MHIAIIGGGFSGAACALHLLRDHPDQAFALTIVEARDTIGAGLAYSAPSPTHRTNVAAARMSVLPEDALHFHRWLHEQGVPATDPDCAMPDGRLYPARKLFGQYVDGMLRAQVAACPLTSFTHRQTTATGITAESRPIRVALADGTGIAADAVVLAVSHTAPDMPAVLRGMAGVLADPWDIAALAAIPGRARVCVVGTGLTACDVVACLLAQGHRGRIDAVSRHGLLPRPRTDLPVEAEGDFSTGPEVSGTNLLRRVRRAIAAAQSAGRPWENIVDALRQQSADAWGTLDWAERRRLLRHLRTYWDVHRFQSAPQIDAALARAQEAGVLRVRAARLRAAHPIAARNGAAGIEITLSPRGAPHARETLAVDVVVNCTGPGHRGVTSSHPVLRGLVEQGALGPDPAELGIWVDTQSRVLRADGKSWNNLFVAGPLARGTFGELMGLPQVNLQPRAVAASLAALARAA